MNTTRETDRHSSANSVCVAYTTDAGYLFPTFVSAMQARTALPRDAGDVIICYSDDVTQESERVASVCEGEGIRFCIVRDPGVRRYPAMYTRFFLDELLGSSYERILYIDGDTQISGMLTPLLDTVIPDETILAAPDPMTLTIERSSRTWRERRDYLASIGLTLEEMRRYFNSGVIYFKTKDWASVREQCFSLRASRGAEFRFPDQDLLNLVLRDRHQLISFKWNFPSYFLNHRGVDDALEPVIYHFMSNPRPWEGPFRPWGHAHYALYDAASEAHPDIGGFRRGLPSWKVWKYRVQQPVKAVIEAVSWRQGEFLNRLRQLEAGAVV